MHAPWVSIRRWSRGLRLVALATTVRRRFHWSSNNRPGNCVKPFPTSKHAGCWPSVSHSIGSQSISLTPRKCPVEYKSSKIVIIFGSIEGLPGAFPAPLPTQGARTNPHIKYTKGGAVQTTALSTQTHCKMLLDRPNASHMNKALAHSSWGPHYLLGPWLYYLPRRLQLYMWCHLGCDSWCHLPLKLRPTWFTNLWIIYRTCMPHNDDPNQPRQKQTPGLSLLVDGASMQSLRCHSRHQWSLFVKPFAAHNTTLKGLSTHPRSDKIWQPPP